MSNVIMEERETSLSRDPSLHLLFAERARALQAQAIGDALTTSGRLLVRFLSIGIRGIVSAVRERRTIAELARLDDRTLSDIGVQRAQVPAIARALVERRDAAPPTAVAVATRRSSDHGDAANDDRSHAMAA